VSAFARLRTVDRTAVDHPRRPVPAVTLSFNLKPGSSLGDAVTAIQNAEKQIGLPETVVRHFPAAPRSFARR